MLRLLGLLALWQTFVFADAHIFVLHRFDDTRHASTSISTQTLARHFEYLKKEGYHFATHEELTQKIAANELVPDHWVHFSIDDTYKSFYTHGLPLFQRYGVPFSLYVYTKAVEKGYKDYMSWEEIRHASQYGTIGLHSHDHPHLTHLSNEAVLKDTQTAYDLFTKHLGFKPTSYAYPYGEYNAQVKKAIKSFGFASIMNQNVGAVSAKTPLDDIDRIALMQDTKLSTQLRIKHLSAVWKSVEVNTKTKTLRRVEIELDPSIEAVELYVTGHSWQKIKTKKGKITQNFQIPLKNSRSRIIIKTFDNAWSSYIIVL